LLFVEVFHIQGVSFNELAAMFDGGAANVSPQSAPALYRYISTRSGERPASPC
jgi:hypothetical protein